VKSIDVAYLYPIHRVDAPTQRVVMAKSKLGLQMMDVVLAVQIRIWEVVIGGRTKMNIKRGAVNVIRTAIVQAINIAPQIPAPRATARAKHARLVCQAVATLATMESIWMKVGVLILWDLTTITVKVVTAHAAHVMEEEAAIV